MRRRAAPLLAVLLAGLLLPLPSPAPLGEAGAQAALPSVTYRWWDPSWHMRVPVLLEPKAVDRVQGGFVDLAALRLPSYPATVEVDFAKAIREAGPAGFGWPQDNQNRLASFTFDTNSVRVVEYDRIQGCPLLPDLVTGALRCARDGDRLEDMVVPSTFSPGLWENPEARNPVFDAERNPVGTLQWVLRGTFTAPRLFFVYFDVLQNGAKPPAVHKPEHRGVLDGLHFVRWGTDIVGFAPGSVGINGPSVLMAQALHDNTTIVVSKYTGLGGGVEPAEMFRGTVHALDTSRGDNAQFGTCPQPRGFAGTVCLDVPVGERFFFRVLANRPVIVGLLSLGSQDGGPQPSTAWYPSRDAGLAGTEFIFRSVGSQQQGDTSRIWIMSPSGPQNLQVFFSQNAFVEDVQPGLWSVAIPGGSILGFRTERPVLALGTQSMFPPDRHGLQLMGTHGSPLGPSLVGFVRNHVRLLHAGTGPAELDLASPLGLPDHPRAIQDLALGAGPEQPSVLRACSCPTGAIWRFDSAAQAPLWAYSGDEGLSPVGGRAGQEFQVSVRPQPESFLREDARFVVVGLYNNTRVVVTNATLAKPLVNTTISLHGWIDRTTAGQPVIPPGDWRIHASKPVAVYWFGAGFPESPFAAYFSAKVEPPLRLVGAGEFHGHAVGWTEKVLTRAVGPGERLRVKLTLVNLGRGVHAAPLADDISLSHEVATPQGAQPPSADLSSVLHAGVPSFQARDVTLSLDVPADAPTGTAYQVNVTARSGGNPNFADVVRLIVTVQIRYEFTMRFHETDGPNIQKVVQPEASTCMDVEVRNTGTGDVTLRLEQSPPRLDAEGKANRALLGFDARVLALVRGPCAPDAAPPLVDDRGQPLGTLALKRGERTNVTVYVRAPPGTAALPLELEVQGTALEDATVRQQLSATVFTNVEPKLRLTALDEAASVVPGRNATFRMLIENVGQVPTPIEYGTTGLLPLGWRVAFHGAPPLLLGNGTGNDRAEFTVNLTAAPDAPVGMVLPVNVLATSNILIDTDQASRAFRQSDGAKVVAKVLNNFTLLQPEAAPVTINPGEPFRLSFDLVSAANGNLTLRLAPGQLPRNWTLRVEQPPGPVPLRPGDAVQAAVEVTPPIATKAGLYEVGVLLGTSDDLSQGAGFRNTSVLVRSTVEFRVEPSVAQAHLPPGGQRQLDLRVVNTGNLPVVLRLSAAAPPGYQAQFPQGTRASLQPGEATSLPLLVRAPDAAAETPQDLRILAVDETSNRQREFPVSLQTGQLDLVAVRARLVTEQVRVGEPATVVAEVQNQGTLPANNVAVVLVVNGRGVRNDTLRTLPPGEPRPVTLPWTVDELPREILVVVDADGKYAESNEANNEARVVVERGLPGPPAALGALLAGLLAGLLARRGAAGDAGAGARLKRPPRGGGRHG